MIQDIKTKKVEDWLNEVTYTGDAGYIPADFSLEFVNFIKLVNGAAGEENITPVLHYKMLDDIASLERNHANMVFRGAAKTSLFAEYLFLYLGVYGKLPGFGDIVLALYVSDSIENGVKNMRKNLEFRWENSTFLQEYIPTTKFTDIRWEFINAEGNSFIVKGYGAKALSLDSLLYTDHGTLTIKDCQVGDQIYGADGKRTAIINKSEVFHLPMYRITLRDGRKIKVNEDHYNSVVVNTNPNNRPRFEEKCLTTKELLQLPLVHTKKGNLKHRSTPSKSLVFIKNCAPVEYSPKVLPIEPYTLGLLIGDGSYGHVDDIPFYKTQVPYAFGVQYQDLRNPNVISLTIKTLSQPIRDLQLCVHGNEKFIPELYKRSAVQQRLALLQGLMDTDGTIGPRKIKPACSFCSNSKQLALDVMELVRGLGGVANIGRTGKAYRVQVKLNLQVFRLPRKHAQEKHNYCEHVAITSIEPIALEPSQCIAVDNDEKQFLTTGYTRTHNTGVRGSKEHGVRPMLAVLDDLISDDDARSDTVIKSVEDTIYKAVEFALHPKRSKIIWSGTPFNARDPLYKAIESGAWNNNVYPICEHFPCKEEDFKGAWSDRFPYSYVKEKYDKAVKLGKVDTFNQELMLRIMSEEDRLILDSEIHWYNRDSLLQNRAAFNYYITTDFAVTEDAANDFSVISVWALNYKGFWYWVDGVCKKQLMDKNINDLFRLAQLWRPQQVGIEVSGQQAGFIPWIQDQMLIRNSYFNMASHDNSNKPGIRPNTNKMVRFNIVVPWFKAHQMFFPIEMKEDETMLECINELQLIAPSGMKSKHDDFIDTISQLANLQTFRPSDELPMEQKDNTGVWEAEMPNETSRISSYIV